MVNLNDVTENTEGIDVAIQRLIAKVDAFENQAIETKRILGKMQQELDSYILLSQRQFETIRAAEELQAKSAVLLASVIG